MPNKLEVTLGFKPVMDGLDRFVKAIESRMERVRAFNLRIENGAKAIIQLMGVRGGVDAVFFAGDVLAIGAVLECNRRGWDIPKQVAIAGFDDWEISRRFAIPITTLDIPRYQIGEKAAELMLRRLDGERGKLPPIDVGFRIIERAST